MSYKGYYLTLNITFLQNFCFEFKRSDSGVNEDPDHRNFCSLCAGGCENVCSYNFLKIQVESKFKLLNIYQLVMNKVRVLGEKEKVYYSRVDMTFRN